MTFAGDRVSALVIGPALGRLKLWTKNRVLGLIRFRGPFEL